LNEFGYSNIVDVSSDVNNNNDLNNSSINFIEDDAGRLIKEQRIVFNAITIANWEPHFQISHFS